MFVIRVVSVLYADQPFAPLRAFSLLLGFPERLCSGVFFAENVHEDGGVGLHP